MNEATLQNTDEKISMAMFERISRLTKVLTFYYEYFEEIPPMTILVSSSLKTAHGLSELYSKYQTTINTSIIQKIKEHINYLSKTEKFLKDKVEKNDANRIKQKDILHNQIEAHENVIETALKRRENDAAILQDPWLSEQSLLFTVSKYVKEENNYRKELRDSMTLIMELDKSITEDLQKLLVLYTTETAQMSTQADEIIKALARASVSVNPTQDIEFTLKSTNLSVEEIQNPNYQVHLEDMTKEVLHSLVIRQPKLQPDQNGGNSPISSRRLHKILKTGILQRP
ncbi:hypothetical protein ROZALSC1DRAFT_25421, partial [Rozella allomycis CSF55]